MFYITEIPISSQKYKKGFMIFVLPWRYDLSSSTTQLPCFPSRNVTKNAETHHPLIHDVIIERPQSSILMFDWVLNTRLVNDCFFLSLSILDST